MKLSKGDVPALTGITLAVMGFFSLGIVCFRLVVQSILNFSSVIGLTIGIMMIAGGMLLYEVAY